jgi:hypothetical protein
LIKNDSSALIFKNLPRFKGNSQSAFFEAEKVIAIENFSPMFMRCDSTPCTRCSFYTKRQDAIANALLARSALIAGMLGKNYQE